jgi:hypothetical protein
MADTITKVLGSARYEAHWVQRSKLVQLVARGVLPCANYTAQLEHRPERVLPPMWNMIFFVPNVCVKRPKYFEVSVTMANSTSAEAIVVHDAAGMNEVPIRQQIETEDEQYVVYARLPRSEAGHSGCFVIPADSFVTAIHYRAFGPASRMECEAFVQSGCAGPGEVFRLAGGEIPWPVVT